MPVPGFILDTRHNTDTAFNLYFFRQLVCDTHLIAAALLKSVAKFNIFLLMTPEEHISCFSDTLIYIQRNRHKYFSVEIIRRFDPCKQAIRFLILAGKQLHMRKGKLRRLKYQHLGTGLPDTNHMLPLCHRMIKGCNGLLLTGLQHHHMTIFFIAKEIDNMLCLVVHHLQANLSKASPHIFHRGPYFHMSQIVQPAQLYIGNKKLRFRLRKLYGIDKLVLRFTKAQQAIFQCILINFQQAVIIAAHANDLWKISQQALVTVVCFQRSLRILCTALTDIYRTRSYSRIYGYGFDIVMQMPANDEIHLASLGNRYNIAIVKGICIRMMKHQHTPFGSAGSRTGKICLNPLQGIANLLACFLICCNARIDSIHLKKSPGIAVHHRKVRTAIVKGK